MQFRWSTAVAGQISFASECVSRWRVPRPDLKACSLQFCHLHPPHNPHHLIPGGPIGLAQFEAAWIVFIGHFHLSAWIFSLVFFLLCLTGVLLPIPSSKLTSQFPPNQQTTSVTYLDNQPHNGACLHCFLVGYFCSFRCHVFFFEETVIDCCSKGGWLTGCGQKKLRTAPRTCQAHSNPTKDL